MGSIRNKTAAILVCLVFGLAFGGFGAFALYRVASLLGDWQAARQWVPVQAQVLEARLERSRGKDSTTYRAAGRYAWEIEGRRFEGTRIGLEGGSDNIGDWQTLQYRRLAAAQASGQPIRIWVDPRSPDRAVADRELRGGLLALLGAFGTVFPLVAVGAGWMMWQLVRRPEGAGAEEAARTPSQDAPGEAGTSVEVPATLVDCRQEGERLVLTYAPGRHRSLGLFLTLFGALFTGAAVFMARKPEVPLPFMAVFGLTGMATLLIGLKHLYAPLVVRASPAGIEVASRSLFGGRQVQWPRAAVRRIGTRIGYTSKTGSRRTDYYVVEALPATGRALKLGDGIASLAVAQALADRIDRALRGPYAEVFEPASGEESRLVLEPYDRGTA